MVFDADDISAVTLKLEKNPIGDDGRYRVDRSNVPLCGRKVDHDRLVQIYNGVTDATAASPSVVIIRGEAGTGKSALVESLRSSVTDTTWFVSGKFCQYSSQNNPFSALVEAISDLIDLIVQHSTAELYRKDVKAAVEHHELAFARLIPNFGRLTGEDYDVSWSPIVAPRHQILAFAQFKAAFTSLLHALGRPDHPLVVFLDDLQWMDDESLDFLLDFVGGLGARSTHIMLVGAVRTDDPRGNAVIKALEGSTKSNYISDKGLLSLDRRKAGKKTDSKSDAKKVELVTFIDVGNVDEATVAQIISVALEAPLDTCISLGSVVHHKTVGNPFAVLQFLDLLISEEKIKMRLSEGGAWWWDENMIRMETDVSDNVVQLVERNLERLPEDVKLVLLHASFLGFNFKSVELKELAREPDIVMTKKKESKKMKRCIKKCLAHALKEGLIEKVQTRHQGEADAPNRSSKYKFSHDKIWQACFQSVSETDARHLHLTIGTYLQRSGIRGDNGALDVASHLNRARTLLLSTSDNRVRLAKANYAAAKVAYARSAFGSSVSFLDMGLRTLDYEIKWTEQYELTLQMSQLFLEMSVACKKAEDVDLVVEEVLTNARCIEDKLPVIQSKIMLLCSTCQYKDVISYGREVLKLVGERVTENPSKLQILGLFLQARRYVNRLSDEEVLRSSRLDDEKVRFMLEVYSWLAPSAFFAGQTRTSMYLMLRSAKLSLENGIHRLTPLALCYLGIIEFAFGNYEVAIRNGRLAVALCNELSSGVAQTYMAAYANLVHWTMPLKQVPNQYKQGVKTGLANGEIVWSYHCLSQSAATDMGTGKPLELVEQNMRDICAKMTEFQMHGGLFLAQVAWQCCLNLLGASEQWTVLAGEAMNEAEHASNPLLQQGRIQWHVLTNCKFQLACLAGETGKAEQLALALEKNEEFAQCFSGYDCKLNMVLLWFKLAREDTRRRRKHLAKTRLILKFMKKMRGLGCPNFDNAILLCEAEEAAFLNDPIDKVSQLYDSAIAGAAGSTHHEAMAMEQAARFHIRRRNFVEARRHYEGAKSKYMEWNAYAKVEDMVSKEKVLFSGHGRTKTAIEVTVVVPSEGGSG